MKRSGGARRSPPLRAAERQVEGVIGTVRRTERDVPVFGEADGVAGSAEDGGEHPYRLPHAPAERNITDLVN